MCDIAQEITAVIDINTIEKVRSFVQTMQELGIEAYVQRGRCVVDARSLLGILSLDVLKPLNLILCLPDDNYSSILETISPYMYRG